MSKRPGSPLTDLQDVGSPRQKKVRINDIVVEGNFKPASVADTVDSDDEREANRNSLSGAGKQPVLKETDQDVMSDGEDDEGLEEETQNLKLDGPPEEYSDLYLDTINRKLLDFDFEKLCSVSLANINVYACLVCGKYFQGRGKSSHAYFHSVDVDHHVFINMATLKVYILPEGYEVQNKTLEDIKYVVNPTFTREDVAKLDKGIHEPRWDLTGRKYVPGFVGLNNIKQNDYLNVIVQALAHVPPLRNFLLLTTLPPSSPQILQRFSILVRKLWSPRAFKSHVSPHELLQEVSRRSNKRFTLTQQADPMEFLTWFLNTLHLSLGGSSKKPQSSLIHKIFQGTVTMQSQTILKHETQNRLVFSASEKINEVSLPFLTLTLDLPPAPLFTDANEGNRTIIPQVSLARLLSKYDGETAHELRGERRRYTIVSPPPPYLILKINRFTKNKFVQEKNPTIVTFPTESLDMSPFIHPRPEKPVLYDLVANIVHESVTGKRAPGQKGQGQGSSGATIGTAGTGAVSGEEEERHVWKCQVRRGTEWVEIQDLWVEEVRREILFLGESCAQIWERRRER